MLTLVGGVVCVARTARAVPDDGAYGRLRGDVTVVAGIGGAMIASSQHALATADLRARYLDAAGVAIQYEEGELRSVDGRGDVKRSVLTTIEFRPLFPVRFLKHMEQGRGYGNLVLDSIGVELGAIWSVRAQDPTRRAGLVVGMAFELPIAAEADGPWARFAWTTRWSAQTLEGSDDPGGRAVVFSIGLGWHSVVTTHTVDAGDRNVQ